MNPYKKELMRLDALVVRLRAKVKQLEKELAEEKGKAKPFNPSQISREDGLDFFEAYTGLQIKRMKL